MRFTVALLLTTIACGGTIDHPRMCARLENGECPDGLDMFLRKEKRLHVSGERAGSAGTKVVVTIEDLSQDEEDGDEPFYVTQAVLGKEDKVVVPLDPGAFRPGAYRLTIAESEKEPDRTIEFSVWNTQAEIDARKGLKSFGARISDIRICKGQDQTECDESYSKLPASSKEFRFSFHYEDSEPESEVAVTVLRNGGAFHSMKRSYDSAAGVFTGYIGFEKGTLPRGNYTLVLTSTKSKQGAMTRGFLIE